MSKVLYFYGLDEYISDVEYCKRKGLKPYKKRIGMLNMQPMEEIIQYTKSGYIYDVLNKNECYSNYVVIYMRLPRLSYERLLELTLNSKYYTERAGSMGIILKYHLKEFEEYLQEIMENGVNDRAERKKIIRMVKMINNDISRAIIGDEKFDTLLSLSEKMQLSFARKSWIDWIVDID